ncbi:MAG: hypothetical protein RLZZ172_3084 [Bacteroidota bacterium]|jgi:uncharacterized membrane protein/mono/diheme cytochrome c family protein
MITSFLGHLHPILLHLPIGIFSLAFVIFYFNPDKSVRLSKQLGFILLLSWISAMLSAASGFLLNTSGEYNEQAAETHQWSAIAFTILCGAVYFLHRYNLKINQIHKAFQPVFIAALIAMVFTGHAGGSLTHGADFLWPQQEEAEKQVKAIPVLSDTSSFTVYDGLVQPLLAAKCESCHKAGKQKGGLRMDDFSLLLKGGKNGKIIQPGDAASSEMIARIMLPQDDDKHMPPKGKKQLTEKETALLHWWIMQGANSRQSIREVASNDTVRQMLQVATPELNTEPKLPVVAPVDTALIKELKASGFTIRLLAEGSGWLDVSTINMKTLTQQQFEQLVRISANTYGLSLADQQLTGIDLKLFGKLTQLRRLDIRNTPLGDSFLSVLSNLENLEYLNLVGTTVSDQGLKYIVELKGLRKVYCWNTQISVEAINNLKLKYPQLSIIKGL